MNTKTTEKITEAVKLIDKAAQVIQNVNDALGGVIIRAADIPTSGNTIGAARETLPNVMNQVLYAARQIEQALKEEEESQKEETESAEQPVQEKPASKKASDPKA